MARDRMTAVLRMLTAMDENASSTEEMLAIVQSCRADSKEASEMLDRFFLREIQRIRLGLVEAEGNLDKLRELIDRHAAPPWHIGIFVFPEVSSIDEPRAVVAYGGSCRAVGLAEGVALDSFTPGDEVFLGADLNLIMGKSPRGIPQFGETGLFGRYTHDGRIVLLCRDEELVVEPSGALMGTQLEAGDKVRFDKSLFMAFEKLERAEGREFLLSEVPEIGRDQVGGQDENLEAILACLTQVLVAPEEAKIYGLSGRMSILMCGAPGCGKTLMARVAASEVTRLSGKSCSFSVVKPGQWQSPWVGVTETNIRNCFKTLREAANDGLAVLFLDEIESIGRIRGNHSGYHADKFLATLLAELDGFDGRGGVAVIAATNRKDLVDPALLERLSDLEIQVNRPDRSSARAIFEVHLPPILPYSSNGTPAEMTRQEIIETAISRFYSPNAENELSVLRFRDGRTRTVTARELASGRTFKQVCRAACQAAFLRKQTRGGDPGLRVSDMDTAVTQAMNRLRSTLTPTNVHAYLDDLPESLDVVEVTPISRQVTRPNQYLILDTA